MPVIKKIVKKPTSPKHTPTPFPTPSLTLTPTTPQYFAVGTSEHCCYDGITLTVVINTQGALRFLELPLYNFGAPHLENFLASCIHLWLFEHCAQDRDIKIIILGLSDLFRQVPRDHVWNDEPYLFELTAPLSAFIGWLDTKPAFRNINIHYRPNGHCSLWEILKPLPIQPDMVHTFQFGTINFCTYTDDIRPQFSSFLSFLREYSQPTLHLDRPSLRNLLVDDEYFSFASLSRHLGLSS